MNINYLVENAGNETGKIIIVIIVVATVVIGLAFLIFWLLGINRLKNQVKDISRKYDTLHDLLIVQLKQELKRVQSISQINVEYEPIYNRNNDLYQEILNIEDSSALNAVNSINRLLTDKKYRIVKEEIDVARNKVLELEEKYKQLGTSIGEIVNVDDENRQEILRYRRYFRDVKDQYESRRAELKYIEASFISVFEKVEENFVVSEKLLAGAHYNESREKFPEIERVLKALDKSLAVLPKLVTLSFVVLPSNIEELSKKYNEMVADGYPLHHLKVQSSIESFYALLDEIHYKLENFQTKNIEFELNKIRDSILKLGNEFDEEAKAKTYFSENYENIYNGSYRLENRFIKLRRIVPDYKTTYLLRESCFEDLEQIQKEINELGTIKRTLDTYVHASSQQPYSTLAKRLKELGDAMAKIEASIDNIQAYLGSLKHDSDSCYEFITKSYISLKKYESELRKICVPNLNNILKNQFNQCYEYINRCGEILLKLPIDVDSLNENFEELKQIYSLLNERMESLPELAQKAEEAIVYANQYRQEFYDVKTTLLRAEKSFSEGDFIRTSDETVTMIKKIRPESGK